MLDVELTEVNGVFQSLGKAVLAASADEDTPRDSAGSLSLNSENSVLSFLGLNKDTLAEIPGVLMLVATGCGLSGGHVSAG